MWSRRFSLRPTLSSCHRRFALQANAAQADTRRVSIMVGFIGCAFLALSREFHYQIVEEQPVGQRARPVRPVAESRRSGRGRPSTGRTPVFGGKGAAASPVKGHRLFIREGPVKRGV